MRRVFRCVRTIDIRVLANDASDAARIVAYFDPADVTPEKPVWSVEDVGPDDGDEDIFRVTPVGLVRLYAPFPPGTSDIPPGEAPE